MNQFCPFCCSVDEPVLPFCCSVDEHVLPFCCSVDQYEPVLLLSGSEDEPVLLLSGSVDGPVLLSVGLSSWWSSDEKLVLNDLLYCTCTAYNCTGIQSTYTVCRGQYTVCVLWSSTCIRNSTYILRGSYSMTANRFFTFVILQAGRIYNLHAVRDLRVKILFCFNVAFWRTIQKKFKTNSRSRVKNIQNSNLK